MAIQFTSIVGGITKDVIRDTVLADPRTDEVIFVIGDTVDTVLGYQKSRIYESALELADRFLNNTQYVFTGGIINGLTKKITDANGFALEVAAVAAVPANEVAILVGSDTLPSSIGNSIIYETIVQIAERFLETDGVST